MTDPGHPLQAEDSDIERLLQVTGARPQPPAALAQRARARLHDEWLTIVAARRMRRRRITGIALAASILLAAVGAWLIAPQVQQPDVMVASVVLARGDLRVADGWAGRWRPVADGENLHAGQQLMTGPEGRGALLLPGGLSLRLDHGTRLALRGAVRFDLERGSVYLDTGAAGSASGPFVVGTPIGEVQHLGTQYEVRLNESAVSIRIREGRVGLLRQGAPVTEGRAGERLQIESSGRVTRGETDTYGASWSWVTATAPGFDLDGRTLAEFLGWVARELGQPVAYDSPAVAEEARAVVLSGSVTGLTPDQALTAVMATTQLRATVGNGQIVVAAGRDTRPR